jgi:(p)ppGpp synthase/HD superfamily hydrolase
VPLSLLQRADDFADLAHGGQRRALPGGDERYIEHPRRVAAQARALGLDEEIQAAALLHDVVEDTPVTLADVEDLFGPRVAGIVDELTDKHPPTEGTNRAERKARECERLAFASPAARLLKLLDLLDNAASVHAKGEDFGRLFAREARALVLVLV